MIIIQKRCFVTSWCFWKVYWHVFKILQATNRELIGVHISTMVNEAIRLKFKKSYKLKYFWETYATNTTIFCAQKLYNRGEIVCFFLYLKCLLKTHEFILIAFFTILLIFSQNLADLWDDRFLIDKEYDIVIEK